jgi:hypothetical protein
MYFFLKKNNVRGTLRTRGGREEENIVTPCSVQFFNVAHRRIEYEKQKENPRENMCPLCRTLKHTISDTSASILFF